MRYRTDLTPPDLTNMSTNERREATKSTIDDLYAAQPPAHVAVKTDRCPLGLKKGDVMYVVGDDVQFCGEAPIKDGTRVVFTRYMYGKTPWGFGLGQYVQQSAMFMFAHDQSERSLMDTSVTPHGPRSLIGRLRKAQKLLAQLTAKNPRKANVKTA